MLPGLCGFRADHVSRKRLREVPDCVSTSAPIPRCVQEADMSCQHTKTSVMTASCGCRKPSLAQRRRQVNKSRDASPILAAKAPRSADLEQLSPKKVSMVSLGCPKNTVDGKRFILQRHLPLLLPCTHLGTPFLLHRACIWVWPVCVGAAASLIVEFIVSDYCTFCSMYPSWHMQPCSSGIVGGTLQLS